MVFPTINHPLLGTPTIGNPPTARISCTASASRLGKPLPMLSPNGHGCCISRCSRCRQVQRYSYDVGRVKWSETQHVSVLVGRIINLYAFYVHTLNIIELHWYIVWSRLELWVVRAVQILKSCILDPFMQLEEPRETGDRLRCQGETLQFKHGKNPYQVHIRQM